MADFKLWERETLECFAAEAAAKLAEQEREITVLQDQVKTLHLAWKNALRESVANATVGATLVGAP